MKLLVVTQVVDQEDSILGFFVRWIEEFATYCEHIEVVCLKEGRYSLPTNVRVHSLGKEGGISRAKYPLNFYRYVWGLRHNYDAVFVHMNPEYIVLGGFFWRLWNKRVALWYTHKSVNLKLRIAIAFADVIFTASRESFRLQSKKVHILGHGIDTNFFSPDTSIMRGDWILSVGRLMPSKRHDLAIQKAVQDGVVLRIIGEGPERARLEALANTLHAKVQFLGALTQSQLRDEYRRAAYLIHTSETGSLDKVVLEALACGLPVRTNDPALKALESANAAYVREHHSLSALVPHILSELQ